MSGGVEACFGVCFKDFALVAADRSQYQSIIVQKTDEDKVLLLDESKLMTAVGEAADRTRFSEYIQKNLSLYKFRNSSKLSTFATANFIRGELATALRQGPYQTNLIVAGWDEKEGASMYWMDYLACMHKQNTAAHGYCSNFILSLMDKHYREDMTVDEALALIDMCIEQIRMRLIVSPPNFTVKIVDKDGARLFAHRNSADVIY